MISLPTRTISVTDTPVSIRKTPLASNTAVGVTAPGAIDTDEINVPSVYDWQTGLEVVLSTSNAMPTGLTAGISYWLIIVDATTISLAESYADAFVPTPASITDNTGTGTLTITPVQNADPLAYPVQFAMVSYASGGDTIQLLNNPDGVYGDGMDVPADTQFNDVDQSLARYAVASGAGPTDLLVTDFQG